MSGTCLYWRDGNQTVELAACVDGCTCPANTHDLGPGEIVVELCVEKDGKLLRKRKKGNALRVSGEIGDVTECLCISNGGLYRYTKESAHGEICSRDLSKDFSSILKYFSQSGSESVIFFNQGDQRSESVVAIGYLEDLF